MKWDLLGLEQGIDERLVAHSIQGDIEVVALPLFVPRGAKDDLVVDRIRMDRGRDGVVEVEILIAEEGPEIAGQLGRRQRPGREDHLTAFGHARHDLAARQLHQLRT